ncbi:Major Facilitator Superfamily [Nesidiocoris tenuis]|uniref:Major Facilitator Superfamily n=1 Tax=Nesidiocoris tenuis TaxID=355587 RepID=A0ABN7ALM6_9HEMI|nr:Major Facilitator Superfamily [Nesidiocoris tenuis]
MDPPPKPTALIGTRHRQIFIIFCGLFMCYIQRANLAVGLVAMTDSTANPDFPTVQFTTYQKGLLSGVFYWGYLTSGIPLGYLADKYGSVRVMSIAGGIFCGIATIIVPYAAINWSFEVVCASRIIQGLGQGSFLPSTQSFLSKWAIPQEREYFAWVWSGCQLGTIVMTLLGGVIAESPGGWPTIFYASGGLSIAWGIFCLMYGASSPAVHKTISKEEKDYIEINFQSSSKKGKNMKIPFKAIFLSTPMWALLICQSSENWAFSIILTLMPTYLSGVYDLDVTQNGVLSALPYIAMFLCTYLFSYLGTHLRGKTSVHFNRMFWSSIAMYGTAAALMPLCFLNITSTGAVVSLMLANGLNGAVYLGYLSNHLDLAPNYAGFLLGVSNALGNITSIIAPSWAGYVVEDDHNMQQWGIVFLVSALVKVFGNTVFLIFGSTTVQPWNDPDFGKTNNVMKNNGRRKSLNEEEESQI